MFSPLILVACTLREWRDSDHASLVQNANNPNVARNLRDIFPSPYTPQHAREWLALVKKLPAGSDLAIEVQGQAVGGIGFHHSEMKEEAEIGFWLGESYWNRGVMTEALAAFTRHVFRTFPVRSIHACVYPWNLASCRVFEKAGYTNEGQIGSSLKGGQQISSFRFSIHQSAVV